MKILYVEDDKLLREVIVDYFKLATELETDSDVVFELTVAEDGEEGLELYKKNKYDLVFTDVNMPKMDGITMLKEMNKFTDVHPPLYVVTGFSKNDVNLKVSENDIPSLGGVIFKPVLPDLMVAIAGKVLKNEEVNLEELKKYSFY